MSSAHGGHGHGQGSGEASAESIQAGHEVSDAHIRPLILTAAVIAGVIVVSFALISAMLFFLGASPDGVANHAPQGATAESQLPPSPLLEQNPAAHTDTIVDDAHDRLEHYGWVDERAGTAHIPIERAMELVVERGIGGE